MKELEKLVSDRFERFGTAGNAKKIHPISLPKWQIDMQMVLSNQGLKQHE